MARDRLRDGEIGGDLGEQAHDDELGQADTEASEGERIERDGHDVSSIRCEAISASATTGVCNNCTRCLSSQGCYARPVT